MNHLEIKSGKRNINEHTKFRIPEKKLERQRNGKKEKERGRECGIKSTRIT